MSVEFLRSCKSALRNLISSERIEESDDPYSLFSDGVLNFVSHYCLDDHTSTWCHHLKVRKIFFDHKLLIKEHQHLFAL